MTHCTVRRAHCPTRVLWDAGCVGRACICSRASKKPLARHHFGVSIATSRFTPVLHVHLCPRCRCGCVPAWPRVIRIECETRAEASGEPKEVHCGGSCCRDGAHGGRHTLRKCTGLPTVAFVVPLAVHTLFHARQGTTVVVVAREGATKRTR